ncbi:MAG: hypothetical protein EBY07_07555, partial [Actinobacteria bacterium]|nr:hypothetical protein [Actinomycetota bacterium]
VPGASVLPVLRRGNVRGALTIGLGRRDAIDILSDAAAGSIDCLVLVGSDPIADCPDTDLARRALAAVPNIIAIDTFATSSSAKANVLLPGAAFGEKDGTTTNLEGRVTRLARKVNVAGTARPDWMVAIELADILGHDLGVGSVAEVHADLISSVAEFASATRAALSARPDGVLLNHSSKVAPARVAPPVADKPGFGYRLVVGRKLYDNGRNVAESPSLAPLAPGAALHMHPLDLERLGASSGSTVKVSGDRTSIIMEVEADEQVQRGTVWAAWAQSGANIGELIDATKWVNDVKVETL